VSACAPLIPGGMLERRPVLLQGRQDLMGAEPPPELAILLDGPDPASRDRAWAAFLARYHRLLLKAASTYGGDYDARMDRYQHLVEALAADDYHRLRAYRATSLSSFPAWLTVVARRLCVDFDRSRHGRGGRATVHAEAAEVQRRSRRRLEALASAGLDPDLMAATDPDQESRLAERERHDLLQGALASLEPRDRLLIRLRFEDDLSVRQIADVMHFPTVFHVYRHLRAVLATVRQRLADRGVDR